jgi:hypothetical protein
MVWAWSHTEEAYGYAEEKLHSLPRETLLDIAASWCSALNVPHKQRLNLLEQNNSLLAMWIWERASSWGHGRNCSNGGHELYLDADGYHTVDLRQMPKDWQPADIS